MAVTRSAEETEALGESLGRRLKTPLVVALFGDLGAGKTTFTRGVCRGLGVSDPVTSPTFVLQHIYEGAALPVYHFDAYRLNSARDLMELGFEECEDGIVLLEWSERVMEALGDRLEVHLAVTQDGRSIEFRAFGPVAEALC